MNIEENLTLLANTKESIRQAINTKGGSVESGTPFSGYSEAISSLPSGGPEVLPEGIYAIDITSTGETQASSDIDWYAGFASIQSFDPEGIRYQDRYINVWTTAPASSGNPDYTIHVNYDTSTHEVGVEQNDAYLYSPLYISYGYAVKEVEDPANSGNTIWLAFLSARETGRYYIQVVGNDHPLIGSNYALPPGIPEGLWEFDISSEFIANHNSLLVTLPLNHDNSTTEQHATVNIYQDPNGQPVNRIEFVYVDKTQNGTLTQTNTYYMYGDSVGYLNGYGVLAVLLCQMSGKWYIEVVGNTNPRFYDNQTGQEIYPNNYVNS